MLKSSYMKKIGVKAKQASNYLSNLSEKKRNDVLKQFCIFLKVNKKQILRANKKDIKEAKKIKKSMIDRLKLDGKKIIFTNGPRKHAINVTQKIGIDQHFEDIFDIIDCNFVTKPMMEPYKKLVEKHKMDPNLCVFVEDIARNLKPAY